MSSVFILQGMLTVTESQCEFYDTLITSTQCQHCCEQSPRGLICHQMCRMWKACWTHKCLLS